MIAATGAATVSMRFAGVTCCIAAPDPIAASLRAVFSRHLAQPSSTDAHASIAADDGGWWLRPGDSARPELRLSGPTALEVANAVIEFVEGLRPLPRDARRVPGIALSRDGDAVILNATEGADHFLLIAQLATRDWRLVATAQPIIDADGRVSGIQRLLSARTSAIPQVPAIFRGAIEMSPWQSANGDIEFYAIDPATTMGAGIWSDFGTHRATVRLGRISDGQAADIADLFEEWWWTRS